MHSPAADTGRCRSELEVKFVPNQGCVLEVSLNWLRLHYRDERVVITMNGQHFFIIYEKKCFYATSLCYLKIRK